MEISGRQFGLAIAYLLPGFVGLAGVAPLVPTVATWLQPEMMGTGGVTPSVYTLVGATTLGLVISCFRWLLVDSVLHRMGLHRPVWKDQRLDERLEAFDYLVENHYRYYQFYANTMVATFWSYPVYRITQSSPHLGLGTDLGALILCAVLFAGAKDALAKYYERTSRLIGYVAQKGIVMTNGNHHAQEAGAGHEAPVAKKPVAKPEVSVKPQHTKAKQITGEK